MAGYDGLHPELARRVRAMLAETGGGITSGYRSYAQQKRLYDGWVQRLPGFAPANPPCQSNHEAIPCGGRALGLAVDLNGNYDRMGAAARRYRLHRPIAREPWHFQPVEVASSRYTGMPLPEPSPEPPPRPPEPLPLIPPEDPMRYPFTPIDDSGKKLRCVWVHGAGWPLPKAQAVSRIHFGLKNPDAVAGKDGKRFTVHVYVHGQGGKDFEVGAGIPGVDSSGSLGVTESGSALVQCDVPIVAEYEFFLVPK